MNIEIIRATTLAQQAGAFYVRIQGMARQHHISLEEEFDEHDTPDTKYIVAIDDYLPIATCRLFPLDDETIVFGRVVVIPDYRRKGVGTQVIKAAEEWARELGYRRVVLDSRDDKMAFYESMGFVADLSQVKEDIFRCVRMTKEL